LREGLSDPSSPFYDQLISFTYKGPAPVGYTAAEHVAAAKKRLCALSNVEECDFDRFRDQSHLPMAVTEHFGLGALLFLPEGKDAYRQIHKSRTALFDISRLIEQVDEYRVLKQIAHRLWCEVVWFVWEGEEFGWNPKVVEMLKPPMTFFVIMDSLEAARTHGKA